ncbi:MAG TPA: pepsin/retropepsin-like aspartic protease family protein [Candidatus Udaeobacter sp.]|nr:pepsin/retropepsin-like aspartic protease family protein [Candidatus Udaeobacter sp.]
MSHTAQWFGTFLAFFAIIPREADASVAEPQTQLNGYKAVPVYYSPLNKMMMSARINGQRANLLVDTGSSQVIVDAAAAASFGIRPSQGSLGYVRFTRVNGEQLPVGYAPNLTAGNMSFGSLFVALATPKPSNENRSHIDGVLGLDLLTRHKAVINCRTKLVFFKTNQRLQMNLSSVAAAEKFTKVPLRREGNGALTVPCSIRGHGTRLLVDTGSFVTIFHEPFVESVGISPKPTRVSAYFGRGAARKLSAAEINNIQIGDFKAPTTKFGVTALPGATLTQGGASVRGILGMDTLYNCNGIIDLENMSLFLK